MLKCFNLETKPNDVINLTDDIKHPERRVHRLQSAYDGRADDYVLLGSGWL